MEETGREAGREGREGGRDEGREGGRRREGVAWSDFDLPLHLATPKP